MTIEGMVVKSEGRIYPCIALLLYWLIFPIS
jgi:hypothetical protein